MMKRLIALIAVSLIAAAAWSATTTYKSYGPAQTVVITGTDATEITWTNSNISAVRPHTVTFTFDSSVTTTVSVEIRRGSTDILLGTTTATGSNFTLALEDECHFVYPSEVLVLNTGSAVNCMICVNNLVPGWK